MYRLDEKPFDRKQRTELIEAICKRWSEEGMERLEKGSYLNKYTPLYHFLLQSPMKDIDGSEMNFISITELFGNTEMEDRQQNYKHTGGMRLQYLGNLDGLERIQVQGLIPPYDTSSPALMLYAIGDLITNKERICFDKALLYLEEVTKYLVPKSFHLDSKADYYPSTFNVF